jgi:hypothetical protein
VLESKFERGCIEQLRSLPFSYWPDKTRADAIRGIPDRTGCVCGMYIAIEFKRSPSEARKKTGRIVLQKKVLEEVINAGGISFIAHPGNWEDIFNRIQTIAALGRKENVKIRNAVLRGRADSH